MDRERFLRNEYARILESGEFVASEWRDSVDRFIADLWDMTTFNKPGRYLAPKIKSLGFVRDNVEFHFHGSLNRIASAGSKEPGIRTGISKTVKPEVPTAAERRAAEADARLERRQRLAEQVLAWELRLRQG